MHRTKLRSFHHHLHIWYAAHGRRDLPWRNTSDPYAIYLSEIMLQQTQVKTVLERYYFQFLKRFPTLKSLAAAPQDAVLQAWQGLGYYNRALNLHKTAKRCGGALPNTVEELIALPGIGRNTAHAVAAFAFHKPVAVMEANVRRVLSRIYALENPTENALWEKAAALLDTKSPFDYNQAMMDIGALVCKKQSPLCRECPAHEICEGKGAPEKYPAPKARKNMPVRHKKIIVFRSSDHHYFAHPRTTRFLKGLYHFVEVDAAATHALCAGRKHVLAIAKSLGHVRQQYSHFTLEADVFCVDTGAKSGKNWYRYDELQALPVSMAERKIMSLLEAEQGDSRLIY